MHDVLFIILRTTLIICTFKGIHTDERKQFKKERNGIMNTRFMMLVYFVGGAQGWRRKTTEPHVVKRPSEAEFPH